MGSSKREEGETAPLNNDDGFFDPLVFKQSFFQPNHKQMSTDEECLSRPSLSIEEEDRHVPVYRHSMHYSPLLQRIQSYQSLLYQNPIFFGLSVQAQKYLPRTRRRASDSIEEQVRSTRSATRSLSSQIHYQSLVMGMILTLIFVQFNNKEVTSKTATTITPIDIDESAGIIENSKNVWQPENKHIILETQINGDEEDIASELQQEGRGLVESKGYFIPEEGASYRSDVAFDSPIDNAVVESAEIDLSNRQHSEGTRLEQEHEEIKLEAEANVQHQLKAELARQHEEVHAQQLQVQQLTEVELINLKNTWDRHEPNDIAILWHVRASGSSVIRHAVGGCHRLVQASGFGMRNDQVTVGDQVGVIYPTEGSPFVNIDSTTLEGIRHAASIKFADAQVADLVVSPLVYETNELFTQTSKGRFFAVFSHPVDRAVRLFYTMQDEQPALREWTLERYARSTYQENNYLTRQLSNQFEGPLDESHYRKAMEIVRDKFLVGLSSKMNESLDRFEKYFRWTYRIHPKNQERCRSRVLWREKDLQNKIKKRMPEEGDSIWAWLIHHNAFDLRLYTYIEKLYEEQAVFVKGAKKSFRNWDTTCCRCSPATFPPFDLEGEDDDEISMTRAEGESEARTRESVFEGGIRLLRKLPPALISALFVPCTVDDFWFDS